MAHTIREIDEGLDRLEAAEARLTATLDLLDRMTEGLRLIAERLDKIDGKLDSLPGKGKPKWKLPECLPDGTKREDVYNTTAKVGWNS